ncbi:M28 family peptidase [Terricaulis sp.]|uniref:M28 family peptidase n=1 Tax=Terricaulis sp. TaxID=2768686 RepID=UPI0037833461
MSLVRVLALIGFVFVVLMGAGVAVTPPPLRAEGAPGFDARATQARLTRLMGEESPHPVDSEAQDAFRDRLIAEIRALGFEPILRDEFACRPQPRGPMVDCGRVRNIIFSIGPESGPAILAASHYDSVPAGPGASDDGIGLSAWLEIARELKNEHLTRRVIFLISDGEEQALLGAYAFAKSDPLFADVQALVNLEARGTRGPAIFFETNQPNADAVNVYAPSLRPVANSVMADAYTLMPNSTDVTVLTRDGLDVINIAILDGQEDYHTPQDSLASQDIRTVQHMGDLGLAITRTLATEQDRGSTNSLVYTDVAGRAFISAPTIAVQIALGLSALIAFAAFWRAGGERRWRTLAAPIVGLVLAGALAFGVGFALGLIRPGVDYWWAHPEPTRAWCVLIGMLGLVLAALILKPSADSARQASMFWFSALGVILSLLLPGISILFVVSAVIYAFGCLVAFAWKPAEAVGAVLAALAALLIWAPSLFLTELALGFDFPFAVSLLIAVLGFTWFGTLVRYRGAHGWTVPAAAVGVAALACLVGAALVPAASLARPQPLNFYYFFNADTNEGRILAGSARRALPQEFASEPFEEFLALPGDKNPYWATTPQASQPIAAPAVEFLGVEQIGEGDQRVVQLRLHPNGVYRSWVRLPRSANPISVSVNGVDTDFADVSDETDYVNIACQGRSCENAEIAITLAGGADLGEWYLIGLQPGASPATQRFIAMRPQTATAIQFGDSTVTFATLHLSTEPPPPAHAP